MKNYIIALSLFTFFNIEGITREYTGTIVPQGLRQHPLIKSAIADTMAPELRLPLSLRPDATILRLYAFSKQTSAIECVLQIASQVPEITFHNPHLFTYDQDFCIADLHLQDQPNRKFCLLFFDINLIEVTVFRERPIVTLRRSGEA